MKNFTVEELCNIIDTLKEFSDNDIRDFNKEIYGTKVGIYQLEDSPNNDSIEDDDLKMIVGKVSIMDDESVWALWEMVKHNIDFMSIGIIPPPPPPGDDDQ